LLQKKALKKLGEEVRQKTIFNRTIYEQTEPAVIERRGTIQEDIIPGLAVLEVPQEGVEGEETLLFPEEKTVNFLEITGEDNWHEHEYAYAKGNVEMMGEKKETGIRRARLRVFASIMSGLGALALLMATEVTVISLIGTERQYVRLYFAILTAPAGALLRHIIVSRNIHFGPNMIPWYTFLVNMVGTAGLAILTTLYDRYTDPSAPPTVLVQVSPFDDGNDWLSILPAIGTGFFGAFTTVSTFVNELRKSPLKVSWPYGALSLFIAQTIAVFVLVSKYY